MSEYAHPRLPDLYGSSATHPTYLKNLLTIPSPLCPHVLITHKVELGHGSLRDEEQQMLRRRSGSVPSNPVGFGASTYMVFPGADCGVQVDQASAALDDERSWRLFSGTLNRFHRNCL